jgi:2',3'-cyclic-nucleotide 2'-phosphodiesterase
LRLLFVADVFGRPGRRAAAQHVPRLIVERQVDFCVINGENAAGGFGLTANIARKLISYGADVITTGNHVWDQKDFVSHLEQAQDVLRPCNYPPGAPGRGSGLFKARDGSTVGVLNLQGRTAMTTIDCPFRAAEREIEALRSHTPIIFIDFHAEATAEKAALGWHLDGQVSAIVGTHTHVQTADERLLPQGTAYLTDAGMTGPRDSVIGVRPLDAIERFLTQVPQRFKPAEGPARLCGALIDIDADTGLARSIERLQLDCEEKEEEEES